MLDLGDVARVVHPLLLSCLSTPVVLDDQLIGVLTLHSEVEDGFSDEHGYVIEVIAEQVAETFKLADLKHTAHQGR